MSAGTKRNTLVNFWGENHLKQFVAYSELGGMLSQNQVSGRSAVIATYALCGFANFGSIAIKSEGLVGLRQNGRRPRQVRRQSHDRRYNRSDVDCDCGGHPLLMVEK